MTIYPQVCTTIVEWQNQGAVVISKGCKNEATCVNGPVGRDQCISCCRGFACNEVSISNGYVYCFNVNFVFEVWKIDISFIYN